MLYDPNIHHRHTIRLKNYHYTQPGAYFITICTKAKQCLFGNVINGKMQLNYLGQIAFNCWQEIPKHYSNTELDVFVIMPNHLHSILLITEIVGTWQCHVQPPRQFSKPVSGSISTIIGNYKSAVSKQINLILKTKGQSIWQTNYYEHIVRNEESFNSIREYILNNPQTWEEDPENTQNEQEFLIDFPF
ncbi:MAG TPA: transposase [Nostocaceae cyanobacterium]|nr:transposase [Nostocaceae cyanobacterium]